MTKTPKPMLRFNRVIRGVGRIQNSAQTRDAQEFRERDGILTKLVKLGLLDVLRAFKAGAVTMRELVDADLGERLATVLRDQKLDVGFAAALDAWLPESAQQPASRRRYETSARRLTPRLPPHLTVRGLVGVGWRRLRRDWGASDADWNRMRAMVSSFLTCQLGTVHHPHRLEVMAQIPLGRESRGVLPDATPADFWRAVAKAPDVCQPAYVAMAVLGVGPGEYLGLRREDLSAAQRTVLVNGTKTEHRRRVVAVDARLWAWVDRAVPAPLAYRWLGEYWHRACAAAEVRLRMYDLRHLSAQFAADQGATDRDLTVHLGHSNPAMSHRYARRAVARGVARAIGDALLGPVPAAQETAQAG